MGFIPADSLPAEQVLKDSLYGESIEINLEVKNTTGDFSHQINYRSEIIIKSSFT